MGRSVEDLMTRSRYILFYLLAGVTSALLYGIGVSDETFLIGASGAVSGLIGLYAVVFKKAQMTIMIFVLQMKLNIYSFCALWIGSNLLLALQADSQIAWQCHLVGLAFGILYGKANYKKLADQRPALHAINDSQHAA